MQIIEIKALENGAHNNQTSSAITAPPPGWAEIPAGMAVPDKDDRRGRARAGT